MRRLLLVLILIGQSAIISYGQQKINIDGDIVYLRDSLNGQFTLLDKIEREKNNEDTFWIQYDRRPGVDPWIKGYRGDDKFSDKRFIDFFKENKIAILGAITTYDNCLCSKHRTMDSPDMYLINFKISRKEWEKLIEFYPDIQSSKQL
jgi:hypothetical protein